MTTFELLYSAFNQQPMNHSKHLWLLNESLTFANQALLNRDDVVIVTNRWDIAQSHPTNAVFNDFDLSGLNNISNVYFHIPKEKAVLNHLLNQSADLLESDGKITIVGEKNQGIKTVGKNAQNLFAHSHIQKQGDIYLVTLSSPIQLLKESQQLNSQDYRQLRAIGAFQNLEIYSKPGLYGWNKIDAGSELLIQYLTELAKQIKPTTKSVLDLGCGYGYLSIAAGALGFSNLHATDNNAAAMLAIEKNAYFNSLPIAFWPDDIASQSNTDFDLILCNPPFHQGFDHSKALSSRFVQAIAKLKSAQGRALVVVNQFIKLEAFTKGLFKSVKIVAANKSYSVYELL